MKHIDKRLLDELTAKAAASPRRRAHHNLHPVLEDPVQRLCVAIEPGTYIRPHRHADPPTWEVFIILRGAAVFLVFDDGGKVLERAVLDVRGPLHAIEIPAAAWHTIIALEAGTIFLEVKQGPYAAPQDGNWATWAPVEGDPDANRFEAWYRGAQAGDVRPERG